MGKIKVMSVEKMERFLMDSTSSGWSVISIMTLSERKRYPQLQAHLKKHKDVLRLYFADTELPEICKDKAPDEKSISKALEWTKNKKYIAIHCQAGMSRNPALAIVIATAKYGQDRVLRMLKEHDFESSNRLILSIGDKILSSSILDSFSRMKKKI